MSYIDRDDFVNNVSQFIGNRNNISIVLVAADSGIGKHSAVLKLLEDNYFDTYEKISMLSYSATEDTSALKNKYFFKLIKLIQDNYIHFDSPRSKFSFDYFIKHNKKLQRQISRTIAITTISDATKLESRKESVFLIALKYISNRLMLSDPHNYKSLLEVETINTINLGKDYLRYILLNDKIIINLRSTQYIDNETLINLCGLLKENGKSSKSVIIMEYDTDKVEALDSLTKLHSLLKNSAGTDNVLLYNLKALELRYFMEAISNCLNMDISIYNTWVKKEYLELGTRSINKAVNDYYIAEKKGELALDTIPIISYSDYFGTIGAAGLCILSLLDIHGGYINIQLLKQLYSRIDTVLKEGYLNERMELMKSHHLIMGENDNVCFFNRAVQDVWTEYIRNTSEKSKGILVAATKCYDYYENLVRNQSNADISLYNREPILILLKIIEYYIPNRIINLTSYIQIIAQYFTTPEKAWKPISLLVNELSKYSIDYLDTYYNIIDLCCDLELYNEALQIWNDIQEIALDQNGFECDRANFLYCKIHYLADKHDDVISYAKRMLNCEIRPSSKLYYSIYLIITYRACNKYSEIEPIVEYIQEHNIDFSNLIQYGLFLRISETYKSRNDAILDVEESVRFFNNRNEHVQVAKSKISLSFLYTITGELDKGLAALTYAKSILKNHYQHITCNNEAAIRLFQGKYDTYTEDLLKQAVMCSNGVFSNLVIYNNLMILYYENNDVTNLNLRIDTVKNMMKKLIDKHLIAVISYNLSLFLKGIDDGEAEDYLQKALLFADHDAALKSRLYNNEPKNSCERFVRQKPWHVTMLSFWETDFMID